MEILPEHIRASLAHYSAHRQCTCMQCGYVGLMGVHRIENKHSNAQQLKMAVGALAVFAGILFICLSMGIISFPWWLGLGFAVVIYLLTSTKNTYLACPNCNTELLISQG
jgi:hypothetical protein